MFASSTRPSTARYRHLLGVLLTLGLVCSCTQSTEQSKKQPAGGKSATTAETSAAANSSTPAGDQIPGRIEGKVLFQGESRQTPVNGRLLTDIVIYLKGNVPEPPVAATEEPTADGEKPTAKRPPVILDQIEMTFVPHVVTMRKGDTLEVHNSDAVLHNAFGHMDRNQPFNINVPPDAKTDLVLDRTEFIRVTCVYHPHMLAWIAVLPNRYYTKVDEQGQFTLPDVPPGEYELAGWYEGVFPPNSSNETSMKVVIKAGKATSVELDFP